VYHSTTIAEIAKQLNDKAPRRIPSNAGFVYGGRRVGDNETCESINLQKEGTLHLVCRMGDPTKY
jgi:hypothetical protein